MFSPGEITAELRRGRPGRRTVPPGPGKEWGCNGWSAPHPTWLTQDVGQVGEVFVAQLQLVGDSLRRGALGVSALTQQLQEPAALDAQLELAPEAALLDALVQFALAHHEA